MLSGFRTSSQDPWLCCFSCSVPIQIQDFQLPFQHHVFLCSASLPTMMIMDYTFELYVSQPQLKIFILSITMVSSLQQKSYDIICVCPCVFVYVCELYVFIFTIYINIYIIYIYIFTKHQKRTRGYRFAIGREGPRPLKDLQTCILSVCFLNLIHQGQASTVACDVPC